MGFEPMTSAIPVQCSYLLSYHANWKLVTLLVRNRAFSYDVTAAILVFQNKETAAILVNQAIPGGINLFLMQKSSFILVNQNGRPSRE